MVGDVGGEVGGCAAGADENVVLVLAKRGGSEPGGALLLDDEALLTQKAHGAGEGAGLGFWGDVVQAALAEPVVVADAQGVEVGAGARQHALDTKSPGGLRRPARAPRGEAAPGPPHISA